MSDLAWRRFLIGLTIFAFAQFAAVVVMQSAFLGNLPGLASLYGSGASSVKLARGPTSGTFRLTVPAGNPWFERGIRTGDVLDLRNASPALKYRMLTRTFWPGEVATLQIRRGHTERTFTFIAQHVSETWDGLFVANAGLLWMLLFAAIIVWKRPDASDARILAMFLLLFNIGVDFQFQNWWTPWPMLDAALDAFSAPLYFGALALIVPYTSLFARPLSWLRRIFSMVTYIAAAVAIVGWWLGMSGLWTGRPIEVAINFLNAAALCTLVAAIQAARGNERAKLVYAGAPMSLLYSGVFFDILSHFNPIFASVALFAGNAAFLLTPVGLTYSILKKRLLDVSFAINRVVVYTAVSAIVVGVFVLIEWIVTDLLGAGQRNNFVVGAALALGLGLSMRFIHHRADIVLDNIFFRKRHEDEKALRDFAHEVGYITELPVALERAVRVIQTRAHATDAKVILADARGVISGVDENDEALVAMRAWHRPVDLHELSSTLQGEFAIPMVSRGRVVGVLVLGAKADGQAYAPDEFDAIRHLATGVGLAVDAHAAKAMEDPSGVLNAILASLESITASQRSVSGLLQSLDARLPP